MGLYRPHDTRWGYHLKTILHIVDIYPTFLKVLAKDWKISFKKSEWTRIHSVAGYIKSFDFVFNLHLMLVILGYINYLSQSLAKRDKDIVMQWHLLHWQRINCMVWGLMDKEDFIQIWHCSITNMALKFLHQWIIMWHMEDRTGTMKYNQIMKILEDKYILLSLIKLSKGMTIGLMRLLWSC